MRLCKFWVPILFHQLLKFIFNSHFCRLVAFFDPNASRHDIIFLRWWRFWLRIGSEGNTVKFLVNWFEWGRLPDEIIISIDTLTLFSCVLSLVARRLKYAILCKDILLRFIYSIIYQHLVRSNVNFIFGDIILTHIEVPQEGAACDLASDKVTITEDREAIFANVDFRCLFYWKLELLIKLLYVYLVLIIVIFSCLCHHIKRRFIHDSFLAVSELLLVCSYFTFQVYDYLFLGSRCRDSTLCNWVMFQWCSFAH